MKRIIQYWDADMPTEVKALTETWKEMNQDFEYVLFDHKQALIFMKDNFSEAIFNSFKKLTIPAMKCDIFRVAVILKLGGVYVDCGTVCHKPITGLDLDSKKCTFLRKWNGFVCNAWICADKGNPVIIELWNKISDVLLQRAEGNIWALTGPKIFMEIVNEFSDLKLEHTKEEVNSKLNSQFINLIDQKKAADVFHIVNNLGHKKTSHWPRLQRILPLFEPDYNVNLPEVFFDKHLIIHIGLHKTGSTAIQRSLKKLAPNNSSVLFPQLGSDVLQGGGAKVEKMFSELFEEISNTESHTVVLSSEYYSSGNEINFNKKRMYKIWKALSLLTKNFSTSEIVYYVRPQVSSIESRMNQSIKSRLCLDNLNIKKFVQNPSLDYSLFDEVISKTFSRSKITPRVFKRQSLIGGDVVSDFNALIANVELPRVTANRSIGSRDELLGCLKINKMNLSVDEKMTRKNALRNEFNNKKLSSPFHLLNDKQKNYLETYYEKSNVLFFNKYPNLDAF